MTVVAFHTPAHAVHDHADQILGNSEASLHDYRQAMSSAVDLVAMSAPTDQRPYSGANVGALRHLLDDLDPCPQVGTGIAAALSDIGKPALEHALNVGNPLSMAHLHCPVAIPALAAEVLISATNQSLDSWDQSPFGTMVEERVLTWLTSLAGLPDTASGNFTSGGSQSNMTALHLAAEDCGPHARASGVIFTSDQAHFSIAKTAAILGFSADAVVKIPTDADGRMVISALEAAIGHAKHQGRSVVAVVATAGTTDLGAIDPLADIAQIADAEGVWLHVDAAYGGGLLFSRHRHRLNGLEKACSIALDFHKMLFQPISCGALLVAKAADFSPLATKADYLNPEDSIFTDAPNLVERSFQTTRRSDALKVLMTLRSLGRDGLDALIQQTLDNTQAAAKAIEGRTDLHLAHKPSLSTVVFRYLSPNGEERADTITLKVRAKLFHDGTAAVATTVLDGRIHFKLTLLNPRSTPDVVTRVLDAIGNAARELETDHAHA
ncbi:L-2,4-diaminobutyrate decarboxylase [Agrobacterium vitis]|nr:L-2,4-diaminobutyrate decarboxylase [Agrobacterium vitis]MBE1436382.1 L-2,4-diaminobutyrate decarboxylase [Agrobacterium vitis]